ncbi:DUF3833 domain-containing protein [Vibrio sp. S4M6]|uniref:DUF3833 domain-containing protein n=1 Tax=Vibrio sinus TaxID=2946865 RepID=UPI00202A19FF|nr:DUF3833 domain-containing protein [Vibrio sinus]MCL9782372.1 DUF3833 domain-containing protein [Vibrio sinus]
MRVWLTTSLVFLLTACGSANLEQHQDTLPELCLERFFDGKLKAYGIVLDRSGNLLRRFEADLIGQWQGKQGVLKEWFEFDDGEKTTRIWHLSQITDNQFEGRAEDVIGVAEGKSTGSTLYWKYQLQVPVEGKIYHITLDDWMFLIDEKRLFNKTEMTKFGFKVGEIILYIEKVN